MRSYGIGWLLVVVVAWGGAASALGDAVIDLVPDAAAPYAPGQSVVVDINVTSNELVTVSLLGAVLDFGATDAGVGLPAAVSFSEAFGPGYAQFPGLPDPAVLWTLPAADPPNMFALSPGDPTTLATVDVVVNDTGTLTVFPAEFSVFDGMGTLNWSSLDGTLTGGSLDMPVPEPATLALLALGVCVAVRRRGAA